MVDRILFYGKRLVSFILTLHPVRRYRLQRAYLLDAYEQFPGLRRRMLVLWLKLALALGVGLYMRTIELPIIARLSFALACALYLLSLYAEACRIRREDDNVMQIHQMSCEQSRFLQRTSRRYS